MKKNNKAFTLVELLITIVIMMLVLIIALVSISAISKKNKEKSWGEVKTQVITGAKEYFSVNEYRLNTLNGDGTIEISVGKLVEEDYINLVTNPKTGKNVNVCDTVVIKKEDGKYTYTYDESLKEKCDMPQAIVFTEVGAPKVSLVKKCTNEGNNDWCKGDVVIKATIDKNENSAIDKAIAKTYYDDSEKYNVDLGREEKTHQITISDDGTFITTIVEVTNISGKKVTAETSYKIDKTAPLLNVNSYGAKVENDALNYISKNEYASDTWYSGYVWLGVSAKDNLSKVTLEGKADGTDKYSNKITSSSPTAEVIEKHSNNVEGKSSYYYKACDEAGNCSGSLTNPIKVVKLDRTPPKLIVSAFVAKDSNINNTNNFKTSYNQMSWLNGNVWLNVSAVDDLNGVDLTGVGIPKTISTESAKISVVHNYYVSQDGRNTYAYSACDKVGNCSEKNALVYLDKTPPTCGAVYGQGTENNWINASTPNASRIITQECNDQNGSGCNSITKTFYNDAEKDVITISDYAGNKVDCPVGVYIDKTLPDLNVNVYKTTDETTARKKLSNNKISNYTNDTWYSGYVWLEAEGSDNLTAFNITSDRKPDATLGGSELYNKTFNFEKNEKGSVKNSSLAQGISYYTYTICDEAKNCRSEKRNVKLDRTGPNIKSFGVISSSDYYNANNVLVNWDVEDKLSGLNKFTTNITKTDGKTNSWNKNGASSWKFASTKDKNLFVINSTTTPKLTVTDMAGNKSEKKTSQYVLDFTCRIEKTTEPCRSKAKNPIVGQIKVICSTNVDKVTVTYKYKTNSKDCSIPTTTKTSKNQQNAGVFNFRGCGGTYILDYANFTVTKGKQTWKGTVDDWSTKVGDYSESKVQNACSPDTGMHYIKY